MQEHTCPHCKKTLTKMAVSHGAFPVCVGPYVDEAEHHLFRSNTISRTIDLDHRSWLSAWVCAKCGYTELEAESLHCIFPDHYKKVSEKPHAFNRGGSQDSKE